MSKPNRWDLATSEPTKHPQADPSCPKCRGYGFVSSSFVRDGIEYDGSAPCPCRTNSPAPCGKDAAAQEKS